VDEGEPQGRRDLRRPEVALDADEDRLETASWRPSGGRAAARGARPALRAGGIGERSPRGPRDRDRDPPRARRPPLPRAPGAARRPRPRRSRQAGSGRRGASGQGPLGIALPDELLEGERPAAVGQRVANRSSIQARRLVAPSGEAATAWNAASRWRRSGPNDDVGEEAAERRRLDGDGRRPRARAVRRPATSPEQVDHNVVGRVAASTCAASMLGRQAGARRSKMGSASGRAGRPAISRGVIGEDSAERRREGAPWRARSAEAAAASAAAGRGGARVSAGSATTARGRAAYGSSSSPLFPKASSGVTSAGRTRSRSSSPRPRRRPRGRPRGPRPRGGGCPSCRAEVDDLAAVGKLTLP